jgi:hypothetical protein
MITGAHRKKFAAWARPRIFLAHISSMTSTKEERIRKLEAALAVAERVKNGFLAANLREALRDAQREV